MGINKIILCSLGSCLSIISVQSEEHKLNDGKPNVLFIILDDMCDWAKYLGGNNQAITPNLDKLAARGVNFSNAYAAVPLSNPSRTAILTGIQPFETGVSNNETKIADFPLANNSLMMPQHFKNNGYTTICSGKVFHTKPTTDIMKNMWDDMTSIDGGVTPYVKNSILPLNLKWDLRDFEEWTGPDTDFPDVVNSQKIIDFISESHDKPFFAAMGFYRPHMPWTAPKRYFDLYDINQIRRPLILEDDLSDLPKYAVDYFIGTDARNNQKLLSQSGNWWEQLIRAYLACVSFADDRVGLIVDALEKSPYADNTLIVLLGDNGFHHGEKERWGKSALWREACHVPLLIIPPKNDVRISKGICPSVVSLIDLYPTLIDICHLPKIEHQLAGNSLMPLLSDVNTVWNKPSISASTPGNFAVHSNNWNLIKYVNNSYELYNINEDENEFVNLANNPEYKTLVDSLSSFLPTSWYTATSDSIVNSISEDFSSPKWAVEILKLNPTYTNPYDGSNFTLNSLKLYLGKYVLKGSIAGTKGSPNCALPGITHGDSTTAIAYRFTNSGNLSYLEFPKMNSAGKLTIHVRDCNATTDSKLTLQQYIDEDWTTITELPVHKANDYNVTSIDEVITYPININSEVKLRIHGGDKFIQIFEVKIENFNQTGLNKLALLPFKITGRRLMVSQPSKISVYSMIGVLLFEKLIENEIVLPESMGYGLFIVKTGLNTQKIVLSR